MFKLNIDFDRIEEAGWPLIVAVAAAGFILTPLAVYGILGTGALRPIFVATNGLVQSTLLINLAEIALVVVGLMFLLGRLHPEDVGLVGAHLRAGVTVTAAVWLFIQLIGGAISLVQTGTLAIDPLWAERTTPVMLGALVAQLFGNALQEEIVYRGFLLNQLVVKFRRAVARPALALTLGLMVSQGLFALMHIPIRLLNGMAPAALPQSLHMTAFVGLFFALVYHRTGNLFIAVGVHSLYNLPTALFVPEGIGTQIVIGLSVLMVALWPLIERRAALSPSRVEVAEPGRAR